MSLPPEIVADCLINLFGAIGAIVLAREAQRAEPHGAITRRINLALKLVSGLFLLRCLAWGFDSALALHLVDVIAASTPLVALFVAEGLLRRHAPKWLKLAVTAGPLVLLLAKALPMVPAEVVNGVLVCVVVGGFAGVIWLLWSRDEKTLTTSENTAIRRVLLAMFVLAPLLVSDFRSLWPDMPVRLGAVGVLLLLYVGFSVGSLHASAGTRIATVVGFAAIAALFAFGYQSSMEGGDWAQFVRVAAVGFAGLLCAAVFSEARGAQSERNRPIAPLLMAKTPEQYAAEIESHPLLSGARILSDAELSHVRHPAFESLVEVTPLLSRAAAPWGRALTDDGVERALSLMAAHEATDLIVVTQTPLRLLAVSLPAIARDVRSESELHLARLAGELIYSRSMQS